MHHWKAYGFVSLISILPLLIILPFLLRLTGWPHSLTLALLTSYGLGYVWLLKSYTVPFLATPSSITNLPKPPHVRFVSASGVDCMSRPPGWKFLEWIKTVPNNGLIHCRSLGHQRTLLIATTPEVAKQVLNENAYDYAKNEVTRSFLRRFLGDGLVVVEGNQHKLQRKAVSPAFSGKHIKDLVPVMWTKSKEFVNVVAQKAQLPEHNGVIEVSSVASHVTLDIIGVACLGRDFKTLYNDDDELARTYETILNPENRQLQMFFFCNILLGAKITNILPWKMVKTVADCEKTLRRICKQLLVEGRESISKDSKDVDILSVMLRSSVELSEDELIAQLLTFLAAGHETTSAALTWNCYLLAKHPEIQKQLREEIAANVQDKENVTAGTFTDMPLLDGVCNEGFRLYPTVPGTVREAIQPTTLILPNVGPIHIPKHVEVILPSWSFGRSPALWGPDADDFRPSRWWDGTANKDPYSIMTFIHGPRSCIGQNFAKYELKCLLVAVVQRFELELVTDVPPVPTGSITIKPLDGMYLRFREVGGKTQD